MLALIGGDIQLAFATWSAAGTQLKAGKIKALAITGSRRFEEISAVPTTKEAGFPEVNLTNWWLISSPKNIDPRIIQKFSNEIQLILQDEQIKKSLLDIGHTAIGLNPKDSLSFIKSESLKYKNLIQKNEIKVQ
jgi:tripartite-type tricarboxylate transporter receptor subunit TctC